MSDKLPSKQATSREIDAFIETASQLPVRQMGGQKNGKLIFALDATGSRERLWDVACDYQADMFEETAAIGSLDLQLCFYRGFHEFKAYPWTTNARELQQHMARVRCMAGRTQIARVLNHGLKETKRQPVSGVVFIGDAMEESIDKLSELAGQLGLLHVPVFLFQEGRDKHTSHAFSHIARLTGGAHCHFDSASAQELKDLLTAIAVYAVGGYKALESFSSKRDKRLLALTRQL